MIVRVVALMLCCSGAFAADSEPAQPPLAEQVESLKEQVIQLNRDLFILEEDLLYPASTQVVVYLSMDVGEFFSLDGVELKIDGERVTSHLYTEREVSALYRGGIQKLYVGNLKAGEHELTAIMTGYGPDQREYRRGASLQFEKDTDARMLELQIRDSTKNFQPQFSIVSWE